MPNQPAGWLADPHDARLLRWWDGTAWAEKTMPNALYIQHFVPKSQEDSAPMEAEDDRVVGADPIPSPVQTHMPSQSKPVGAQLATLVAVFGIVLAFGPVVLPGATWIVGVLELVTVGLAAAVLFRLYRERPRLMTGDEDAYFKLNRAERPERLHWLGTQVPRRHLPKLRGLYPLLFGAISVQVWLVVILDTGMDDQPNPLRDFATFLMVVLIITTVVTMVRRVIERNRSMTEEEHRYFFEHRDQKPANLSWPGAPISERAYDRWSNTELGRAFSRSPRFFAITVGGILAATVVVASVGFAAVPALAEDGVVTHIVDGDTLDVRIGEHVERVRLLNMNTPELKGVDDKPDCLANEARESLGTLAPVGSTVRLEYDRVRTDKYHRTLAAVTNADGIQLSVEQARLGLGAAVEYGDNLRFLSAVQEGQKDAEGARRGIFDAGINCSPAAIVASATSQEPAMSESLPGTSAEIAVVLALAGSAVASAESADASNQGDDVAARCSAISPALADQDRTRRGILCENACGNTAHCGQEGRGRCGRSREGRCG